MNESINEPYSGRKIGIVGNSSNHTELRKLLVANSNLVKIMVLEDEMKPIAKPKLVTDDFFDSAAYEPAEYEPSKVYDPKRLKQSRRFK